MLVLKQPPKNRWLPWLVLVVLLITAVGAPIRREYTYSPSPEYPNPCDRCQNLPPLVMTTAVHYGAPMAWLTLSKSVDQATDKVTSSNTKDTAKLSLDLMLWGLIVAFYLLFKILGRLKSRSANLAK